MKKRLRSAAWFRRGIGLTMARYLQFVWKTSRFVHEPDGVYEQHLRRHMPMIVTYWHGQHYLTPFVRPPGEPVKALISAHEDAEINAIAAEFLGIESIRGSGAQGSEFVRKGGVGAFMAMLENLQQGSCVTLTADVPKIARVVGRGIVMLARASGRPICPIAVTTSRRIVLNNWDRSVINLPFSRCALVVGDLICVPADADNAALEAARSKIADALNAATARADAIADGREGPARA